MAINTNIEEQLQKLYNKKKEDDNLNEQSSFNYSSQEDKLFLPIGFTVCRIVDLPANCESSFIKCDDDKTRLFKYPSIEENPDFILYKILNLVLKQIWKGQGADGKHIFENPVKDKFPDIHRMIYNNGDLIEGQYGANGWGSWKKVRGKYQGAASNTTCFMNAINRKDFQVKTSKKDKDGNDIEEVKDYGKNWCVENKHTLLLSKSLRSVGCPITVGNLLMKNVFPNFGNFIKYDVAIERMKDDPYYQIWKADSLINNQEVFPFVAKGDLTPEETAINTYDLQEIVKYSSYSFIYDNLKDKISQIDEALNVGFLKELEQSVEKETGKKPEAIKVEEPKEMPTEAQNPPVEVPKEKAPAETSKEEVAKETASTETPKKEAPKEASSAEVTSAETTPVRETKPKPEETANNLDDVIAKAKVMEKSFLFKDGEGKFTIDKLKPEEKQLIKDIDESGTKLTYTVPDVSSCPYCNKAQPTLWEDFCIYCGVNFQE